MGGCTYNFSAPPKCQPCHKGTLVHQQWHHQHYYTAVLVWCNNRKLVSVEWWVWDFAEIVIRIVTSPVPHFRPNKATSAVEKAYQANQHIALFPNVHSIHHLQFTFMMESRECCGQGNWPVGATDFCCRMLWHLKCIRMITAMYISSTTIRRNSKMDLQSLCENFAW